MRAMQQILDQYKLLLSSIDGWFAQAQHRHPGQIACKVGCSGCCRGFFDITLLDAALVAEGFNQLLPEVRDSVRNRATARLAELRQCWPGFSSPFLLNGLPDSEWTEMPEEDESDCPLLGDDGLCLIYAFRPMTCRLHGLPNIDFSGESFSDEYCTLNFKTGDPLSIPELRWSFRQLFEQEISLFCAYTAEVVGSSVTELDTLLQLAPLIDFERTDWCNLTLYTRVQGKESAE